MPIAKLSPAGSQNNNRPATRRKVHLQCFLLGLVAVVSFQSLYRTTQSSLSYHYVRPCEIGEQELQQPQLLEKGRASTSPAPSAVANDNKTSWSYADFFNPTLQNSSRICVPWTLNMDSWWTHNPDWGMDESSETDDTLCFTRQDNTARTYFLQKLYNLQFLEGNCSNVHTKHMWSSGLGADLNNIYDGLLYGLEQSRPFQIRFLDLDSFWHYAALKPDGAKAVCPTKDFFCFFLPFGRCSASAEIDREPFRAKTLHHGDHKQWLMSYVLRPQQWLRRRVYEYMRDRAPTIRQPCAVMHVRRADIVLHGEYSRKYYAIQDYLKKLQEHNVSHSNILLLTDDGNAVDEALDLHPSRNWMYLNRTRYRGAEGGWENQVPSQDPLEEMVNLLATFRLAKQCDTIVHGQSSFSDMLFLAMQLSNHSNIQRLRVDEGEQVYSRNNTESVKLLEERLKKRKDEVLLKNMQMNASRQGKTSRIG